MHSCAQHKYQAHFIFNDHPVYDDMKILCSESYQNASRKIQLWMPDKNRNVKINNKYFHILLLLMLDIIINSPNKGW
jgi:hypothetical protein